MSTTMIADQIKDRLDQHWLGVFTNVAVASSSKQVWLDLPIDYDQLGGRFGWCWPTLYRDPKHPEHHFLVGYCPEIIAEITAHLSEDDRDQYIAGVEWMCDDYIEHMDEGTHDLPEQAWARLCEAFPVVGEIMDAVEARAVQARIIPDGDGRLSKDLVCTAPGCGYVSPAGTHNCPLCGASL